MLGSVTFGSFTESNSWSRRGELHGKVRTVSRVRLRQGDVKPLKNAATVCKLFPWAVSAALR